MLFRANGPHSESHVAFWWYVSLVSRNVEQYPSLPLTFLTDTDDGCRPACHMLDSSWAVLRLKVSEFFPARCPAMLFSH
jgi:hypothetical protein